MNYAQGMPRRTTRHRLVERISELHATIQDLRARVDDLEADREDLRGENRSLRRRLTRATLVRDLLESLGEVSEPADTSPPSAVHRLYRALPATCSFPAFFEVAEQEGLDVEGTRRSLRHLLARDLLVQEGAQLTKRAREGEAP